MVMGFDKLEIGGGFNPSSGYLQVDMDASCQPDIVGDIRAIFTPDLKLEDFEQLQPLADYSNPMFEAVKCNHFIEHVQWLYQEAMFQWFYAILHPNGVLELETPDLMWITKSYLKNKKKKKFPLQDHPNLNKPEHFEPWVNFKLYSGCSLGDYHHCMYDKEYLIYQLNKVGFKSKVTSRGGYLKALAVKTVAKGQGSNDEWFSG